jgi:excisionase family DNA binding protein
MDKLAYTIKEASLATGISKGMLLAYISLGRLKSHKNGSRYIILKKDLIAFLDKF